MFESPLFIMKAVLSSYSKIPLGLTIVGQDIGVNTHGYVFQGPLPVSPYQRHEFELSLSTDSPLFPEVDIEAADFEIEFTIKCIPKPKPVIKEFK